MFNWNTKKKFWAVAFLFFFLGTYMGLTHARRVGGADIDSAYEKFKIMADVFAIVERNYVESVKPTQLINGARAPITPTSIPFYDKYVKTYKLSPTYTAWGQYDALYLLKAVAEATQSLDTEVLIKALEKVRYQGAAGIIAFTKDHDLKYGAEGKQPVWAQWQDGKHVVYYPKQYASGKYISPPWIKKK